MAGKVTKVLAESRGGSNAHIRYGIANVI